MGQHDHIAEGWPHSAHSGRMSQIRGRAKREPWNDEDKAKLTALWLARAPIEEICEELERSETQIYSKVTGLGLPPRKGGAGKRLKRGRRRKLPGYDSTSQRRFTGVSGSRKGKVVLEPHDPRFRAGTTIFPTSVVPASKLARLLKSGHNSRKIGKIFDRGHWQGMPIFTLTFQERETCPRTCLQWADCYGNNMPFAQRIFDDGTLTKRLWGELASLSADFPAGFAVRLHVLGDFFAVDYVEFWRQALVEFPALHIFGFTARRPDDPIGAALIYLVRDEPARFRMRFSGGGYETDCAEVVDKAEDAGGIVCPAERHPDKSCATCGICPSSEKTIFFIRH